MDRAEWRRLLLNSNSSENTLQETDRPQWTNPTQAEVIGALRACVSPVKNKCSSCPVFCKYNFGPKGCRAAVEKNAAILLETAQRELKSVYTKNSVLTNFIADTLTDFLDHEKMCENISRFENAIGYTAYKSQLTRWGRDAVPLEEWIQGIKV